MFLIVSRTRSAARSIIGSPTCACSKSSSPVMRPLVEHELERVVGDEPRRGVPVLRHVVAQPPPEEHRDRIGGQALHQGVVERLHPAPVAAQAGRRRVARAASKPAAAAARERDLVDPREELEVLVEQSLAFGVGDEREVDVPAAAGPSRARTDRRRARTRGGRAGRAPRAGRGSPPRRRSGTASRSAARAHPARGAGGAARRPRRRCPTPVASAPAGSRPTTRPPPSARPRPRAALLVAHIASHGRSHRPLWIASTTKYLEYRRTEAEECAVGDAPEHRLDHGRDVGHRRGAGAELPVARHGDHQRLATTSTPTSRPCPSTSPTWTRGTRSAST